jgi:protein associated with RNAse G/E
MKNLLITGFVSLVLSASAFSQANEGYLLKAMVVNGDTIPIYIMNEIKILSPVVFKNKTDAVKFTKLVKNVKKVYPYAKITGIKVREFDEIVKKAKNEKERKEKMKQAEDELRAQFEDDIKNLSHKQGILLIKLIDRETGESSYELIKEFRGKIMASFYQAIGKLFGYDLKMDYDPQGEDKEIEQIVVMIENGVI